MRKIILVVDDESIHREILFSVINEKYDLLVMSSFENAQKWINLGLPISALVTDYNLKDPAGRTGSDLARIFREKYYAESLILITGAVLADEEESFLKNELKGKLFTKPSSSIKLMECLLELQ